MHINNRNEKDEETYSRLVPVTPAASLRDQNLESLFGTH